MRVALVVHQVIEPHKNGSQVACWAITMQLLQKGHDVYVCSIVDETTLEEAKEAIERLESKGATFYPISYKRSLFEDGERQKNLFEKARLALGFGAVEASIPWLRLRARAEKTLPGQGHVLFFHTPAQQHR